VSGWWIVVSAAGLLWTSAGIYHSMQLALNQVWNVEGVDRQGWVSRHIRALVLFTLVVAAAVGTGFIRGASPLQLPEPAAGIGGALLSVAIASLVLLGVFRIAVSPAIPWRALVSAAVVAGPLWELLQRIGSWIVLDRLGQAEDLYGGIGFVVVMLFWINLLARSAVLANEWAVVSWRGLYPRRIAQPPLTEADRRVLGFLARNERRRPEMHVDIAFDEDAADDEEQTAGAGSSGGDDDVDEPGRATGSGRAPQPSRRGATTR
jgi:hypothetical protein